MPYPVLSNMGVCFFRSAALGLRRLSTWLFHEGGREGKDTVYIEIVFSSSL